MGPLSRLFGGKKKEKNSENEKKPSIAERIYSELPPVELTPEREEELLNYMAVKIAGAGMETTAILFLESLKPLAGTSSQLLLLPAAPFLEIMGIRGYDYSAFFMKRENVERLLARIEKDVENSKKLKSKKRKKGITSKEDPPK